MMDDTPPRMRDRSIGGDGYDTISYRYRTIPIKVEGRDAYCPCWVDFIRVAIKPRQATTMEFPHTLRLILAGLFSLPALLLLIAVAPLATILSIPSLIILTRRKSRFLPSFASAPKSDDAPHPLLQHAIITGGSSGIGLAVAVELAKRKCRHITLVARREDQLKNAQQLVQAAATENATTVHIVSVDVTDFEALQKRAVKLCDTTSPTNPGPPTLLFHCAGYSIPLAFGDLSPSDFAAQVNVNYLGSIHAVKAFLPYMQSIKPNNNLGGNIILTSSMSGQCGSYGYSAYSPTKFALRGFAESLSMELDAAAASGKNQNQVNISLCYPPDTNTPGYEVENLKKPEACRLISESGGIWDPHV
jgi:3-dehydrosphinganine reductase